MIKQIRLKSLSKDRVSGFTLFDCFQALQSDVRSIPFFIQRFQSQHPNNQTLQIFDLQNEYNY